MAERDRQLRRGFLKALTGGVTAAMGALLAIPAFRFLTHPLRIRSVTGGDEPILVSALPAEIKPGKPVRVDLIGARRDGWVRLPRAKLGAAWLVRNVEGRLHAFSTACPHLGCGIAWDETAEKFACPCHRSGFSLDGQCLFGPSPRGMDELELVATDAEIRVRYQRFKLAITTKEPAT